MDVFFTGEMNKEATPSTTTVTRMLQRKKDRGRWHNLTACSHFNMIRLREPLLSNLCLAHLNGPQGHQIATSAEEIQPSPLLSGIQSNSIPTSPINRNSIRALMSGGNRIFDAAYVWSQGRIKDENSHTLEEILWYLDVPRRETMTEPNENSNCIEQVYYANEILSRWKIYIQMRDFNSELKNDSTKTKTKLADCP